MFGRQSSEVEISGRWFEGIGLVWFEGIALVRMPALCVVRYFADSLSQ